jgi:hypothetical protein
VRGKIRYLLGLLVLIAAAALGFFNPGSVMTYVITPVSRLSWLVTRTLMVVDQQVYWAVLIFVVIAFGLRLIPVRAEIHHLLPYDSSVTPDDRAAKWEGLIRQAQEDEAGREALQKALDELHEELREAAGESVPLEISLPAPAALRIPSFLRKLIVALRIFLRGRQKTETRFETGVGQTLDALESMIERQNEG